MKRKLIRHGDLCLEKITSLPEGLTKADTNVVMTGSQSNDHTVENCDVYFKDVDQFVFGYLKTKKGALLKHKEHGKEKKDGLMVAPIKPGVYAMRKQFEDTNKGMKKVVD